MPATPCHPRCSATFWARSCSSWMRARPTQTAGIRPEGTAQPSDLAGANQNQPRRGGVEHEKKRWNTFCIDTSNHIVVYHFFNTQGYTFMNDTTRFHTPAPEHRTVVCDNNHFAIRTATKLHRRSSRSFPHAMPRNPPVLKGAQGCRQRCASYPAIYHRRLHESASIAEARRFLR